MGYMYGDRVSLVSGSCLFVAHKCAGGIGCVWRGRGEGVLNFKCKVDFASIGSLSFSVLRASHGAMHPLKRRRFLVNASEQTNFIFVLFL